MFKDMTIAKKITLGFGGALSMLIVGAIAVSLVATSVHEKTEKARNESTISFDMAMTAQQMRLDVVQVQQWLTDISATRGLDGLADGFDEAAKSRESFLNQLEKFKQHYVDENDQTGLDKIAAIETRFHNYYQVGGQMARSYVEGGPAVGNKMMAGFDEVASSLNESIIPFVEEQSLAGGAELMAINSAIDRLRAGVITGGTISVLGGILISFFLIRTTVNALNQAISNINEGAVQVASASGQVASSSQILAEGASEQAASFEETSTALEELTAMTKQNAENANQANVLMGETSQIVENANTSMSELTTAMSEVSKASEDTSKIIKTIDEIAFQTNLLALNAAVEAARAGEAGAGFAVVADEVRNLAMRSAEAAKNTAALIEGTIKQVEESTTLLSTTNEGFVEIARSSGKVSHLIEEIAGASQEQSHGIDQINNTVTQMDHVTQQNAATAEESASASEELSAQSEVMRKTVADLSVMIGGQSDVLTNQMAPTVTQALPKKKTFAINNHKRLAQAVIPFDQEDEFVDFQTAA